MKCTTLPNFIKIRQLLGSFIDDSTNRRFRKDFVARSSQSSVDRSKPNLGRTNCLFRDRFLVKIVEMRHFRSPYHPHNTFYSHKSWWSMLPFRLHRPKSWWSIGSSGAMAPAPLFGRGELPDQHQQQQQQMWTGTDVIA